MKAFVYVLVVCFRLKRL